MKLVLKIDEDGASLRTKQRTSYMGIKLHQQESPSLWFILVKMGASRLITEIHDAKLLKNGGKK